MYQIDYSYDQIFSRPLIEMSSMGKQWLGFVKDNNKLPCDLTYFMSTDNPQIEYKNNSFGYRCEEFNHQRILTLGCSNTHGHGMPMELTWPYLLSKKMNLSYSNLATGGDGIQAQVIKAFQYFKEIGNPDYIFGVFPLTRIETQYVHSKFGIGGTSSDSYRGKEDRKFIQQAFLDEIEFQKYSQSPHNANEVLPVEFAIFYNLMFIQMLEQYCKSNNIKFLWSIYDFHAQSNDFKNKINSNCYFTDSCFTDPEPWYIPQTDTTGLDKINLKDFKKLKNGEIQSACHGELSKNELFYMGADHIYTLKDFRQGHWGLHKHIHVAEAIYRHLYIDNI